MKAIVSPLNRNSQGAEVSNLQDGLLLLIRRQIIRLSDEERRFYEEGLLREQREQTYNDITQKLVAIFQEQQQINAGNNQGNVDVLTAEALNRALRELGAFDEPIPQPQNRVVRGQIISAGSPINGIVVTVYDRDIGDVRQQLGNPSTTQDEGQFEVTYTLDQFADGDAASNGNIIADLIFALQMVGGQPLEEFQIYRLPDDKDLTQETQVSADDLTLGIEARKVEEVRIVLEGANIPRGPSEFEQIMKALEPVLLQRNPKDLDEARFRDITFVARETGIEQEKIEFIVAAFKLATDPFRQDLQPQVFYGLARTQRLIDLVGLARTSITNLQNGLKQASSPDVNIIPAFASDEELNRTVDLIHRISIDQILNTPAAEGNPALTQILTPILPVVEQQQTLMSQFANHEGAIEQYWTNLRLLPEFQEAGKVEKVQLSFQLNTLTQGNLPLMSAMQAQYPSTRSMARVRPEELVNLVQQTANNIPQDFPGETPEEKLELYSNSIVGLLQGAFPTETVAHVVAKVPDVHFNNVAATSVAQFFNRSTDSSIVPIGEEFDICSTHIDNFLNKYDNLIFGDIASEEKQKITAQVKRTQRLFHVSTSPETFQVLMESNLNSANDLAQMPFRALQEELGDKINAPELELIHQRAMAASATSLHLALMAYQSATGAHPMVVGEGLKEVPNWASLFGSLDFCDCKHCQSVYSPAAYFVDLLQFLDVPRKSAKPTPLDYLIGNPDKGIVGKRPDLPHIPLTCENTNTSIPYIDLVNEVLESYVAFGKLDETTAKDTGDSTAEELSANPQYVEDTAYTNLQNAVFPYNLPFDRFLEIVRVYSEYLGSSRFEIVEAFNTSSTKKLVASSESLSISAKEFEILTSKQFDGTPSTISVNRLYGFEDATLTPTLQLNAKGVAVVLVQAKLNTDGANPQLTLSGTYDAVTQTAVQAFQQKNGLTVDGIVDADDWAVLITLKPDATGALIIDVPEFLHRTGLSYIELVDLFKTFYINPSQQALTKLESAEITYKEVQNLILNNFANLSPILQSKLTQAGWSVDDVRQLIEQSLRTIVLYSNVSDCDLDKTQIQYLDGKALDDSDTWKIQRFIRLWRKLGWTMPELDTTLMSLGYTDTIDDVGIQKLAKIKKLQINLNTPLIKVASLWANIETQGENSLYKKLFLNRAILKQDDAFKPKPDGSVLDGSQMIGNHIPSLLAAFQISAIDLDLIRTDVNLPDDHLTLENVSKLYRYTVLAKALKLKIKDLITLKSLTGRDPFPAREPAATAIFVDIVHQVKPSGFLIAQLNYLYRHIGEPSSNLALQPSAVTLLVKTLQAGLQEIAQENQLVPDPIGELTRSKLASLFEPAIADQTVQMILGTSATYAAPLAQLPDGIIFPVGVQPKIGYDQTAKKLTFAGLMTPTDQADLINASNELDYKAAVNQLQQKSTDFIQVSASFIIRNLANFLNPGDASTQLLTSSINADGKSDPAVVSQKFAYLLERLLPYLRDKLSRSLVKQTLSDSLKIDGEVAQVLLESILKAYTDASQPAIADFLALLGDGLAAAYFNNATFTDPAAVNLVDSMLSFNWGQNLPHPLITQSIFSVRWIGKLQAPSSETYTFYIRANGNLQLWVDNQALAHQGTLALKEGQLYDIKVEYARTNANVEAIAELQWSSTSTPKAVIPQSQLFSGKTFTSFDLPLQSYALLHKIALLVNTFKITAKELVYLSNHADDFAGKDPISPNDANKNAPFNLNILPLDPLRGKAALFDQWLRLANLFVLRESLPEGEIGLMDVFSFAATSADKTQLSLKLLKQLSIISNQNTDFISLLSSWLGVSEVAMKQILLHDWSGLSETAIKTLIGDASQSLTHFINVLAKLSGLQILTLLLAIATGWNVKEIDYLISPQGFNLTLADFKDEQWLLKLQNCTNLSQQLGITAAKLFSWATQAPDSAQAQDIKNTVKAKYDEETWLTVAKPLSDKLRESQKSALVAYVLTLPEIRRANVTDTNRLFEYFLIDVEMSACMMTSRIKQAISSVQLFVQQCLLNLLPVVRPSQIDGSRWEWMKNYRVWEANRKVFLYPENWIEPELRDDKSSFFKELESELLQNDVTDEVAEKALLNYLYKLDQVARLEICGMYLQDDLDEPGKSILHVFGRTMGGMTHSYYYRRLIDNRVWTPWEKVELDIHGVQGSDEKQPDGIDLLPIVWNRRLYVFWLVFTLKAKVTPKTSITINTNQAMDLPPQAEKYWEIKLAWSKYDQGKWAPKQVSGEMLVTESYTQPVSLGKKTPPQPVSQSPTLYFFPLDQYRLRALVTSNNLELQVCISGSMCAGKFHLDNYHREVSVSYGGGVIYDIVPPPPTFPSFMGYRHGLRLTLSIPNNSSDSLVPILKSTPNYLLLPLSQNYLHPLNAPYFYQDGNIYFVRSREYAETVKQVEHPGKVIPGVSEKFSFKDYDVRRDLGRPAFDPVMEKTVTNPWITAEQQVFAQKIGSIANQSGIGI